MQSSDTNTDMEQQLEPPVVKNLAQETVHKEMRTAICVEKSKTCGEVGSSANTVPTDTCTETNDGIGKGKEGENSSTINFQR